MKIVVLSDIHGNLPALHAVAEHFEPWQPDQVIVNGDITAHGDDGQAICRNGRERCQEA